MLDLAGNADKLIKRGVNNFDPATMGEYLNTWFGWSMDSEFPVNSFTADSAVKYNAASTYKISEPAPTPGPTWKHWSPWRPIRPIP